MVELRGVSKSYGSTVALQPTDLRFADGKTTALIGPSGCGKSTLLRLILRIIEPTSGEVLFGSMPVTDRTALEVRRRTGYVIQDGGLFPHLTAYDNVTLVAREVGKGLPSINGRVNELADLVRIPKELLARFPGELSGGQRQRVGLMRALMLRPGVLLLDEPLAALDPMVRAALQTDLKAIFKELGTTVILVTHDMAEAAYLCDSIVLLKGGQVIQQGSLADFQQNPADPFVTEFMRAQRSLVL